MDTNLFADIHYILMKYIDGPAADHFSSHVAEVIGDLDTVSTRFDIRTQMHWMAIYWIRQINTVHHNAAIDSSHNLLLCANSDEFQRVFIAVVVPVLQQYPDLPNADSYIMPMLSFAPQKAC
jgi:hypothetical protein